MKIKLFDYQKTRETSTTSIYCLRIKSDLKFKMKKASSDGNEREREENLTLSFDESQPPTNVN